MVVDSREESTSISLPGTTGFLRLVPPGKAALWQHFLSSPRSDGPVSTEIPMGTPASSRFDPFRSQDVDLFYILDFDAFGSPPFDMPTWSLGALSSSRNLCLLETWWRLFFVHGETL